MKNFVSEGKNVTIAASPYAVSSGEGVLLTGGNLFGIANSDAENGAQVVISTVGVFDIDKDADDVFTVGSAVYFDAGAKVARDDTDSGTDAKIGVCVVAAGAGATTVRTRLGWNSEAV